jgi:hypothetical protein
MKAELILVRGCPHAAEAERRYRTALEVSGHGYVPVRVLVLDTVEASASAGCTRSPTFQLNGVDLLPDPSEDGAACRWTIPTTCDLADAIGPGRR